MLTVSTWRVEAEMEWFRSGRSRCPQLAIAVLSAVVAVLVGAPVMAGAASVSGPEGTNTTVPVTDFEVSVTAGTQLVAGRDNEVTATGTVACSQAAQVSVRVELTQVQATGFTVSGSSFVESTTCDSTPRPWSAVITAAPSPFDNGPARLSASALASAPGGSDGRLVFARQAVTADLTVTGATANLRDAVYYVALGDSLATGFGAGPGEGYVDLLTAHYRRAIPNLVKVNFACNSETTTSMLDGSICRFGGLSQEDAAVAFLNANRDRIALITIDIGGNDVVFCSDADCFNRGVATIDANLATIMGRLRQAAGPNVPFYGMNYFDPLLHHWLTDDAGKAQARQSVADLHVLNQHLTAGYAAFGAPTADVARRFAVDDFTTMVDSPWGQVPINVFNTCTWLTVTCRAGGPQGFGNDANAAGYEVIADAFKEIIDLAGAPNHPVAPPRSPPVPIRATPAYTG
jgi:lysophospholipase L1-like esterase